MTEKVQTHSEVQRFKMRLPDGRAASRDGGVRQRFAEEEIVRDGEWVTENLKQAVDLRGWFPTVLEKEVVVCVWV